MKQTTAVMKRVEIKVDGCWTLYAVNRFEGQAEREVTRLRAEGTQARWGDQVFPYYDEGIDTVTYYGRSEGPIQVTLATYVYQELNFEGEVPDVIRLARDIKREHLNRDTPTDVFDLIALYKTGEWRPTIGG